MSIDLLLPGDEPVELRHLVIDVNGTLAHKGALIEGVEERLTALRASVEVTIASADTYGLVAALAARLGLEARLGSRGEEKAALVKQIGAAHCIALGNGANDALMLQRAALGIAVIGPEGASARALAAADLVCSSVHDALDLLLDTRALVASLRS